MSQCHLGSNINSLIKRMARALILPALTLFTTTNQKCHLELHQLFLNKGEGWDTCSCSSPILPVQHGRQRLSQVAAQEQGLPLFQRKLTLVSITPCCNHQKTSKRLGALATELPHLYTICPDFGRSSKWTSYIYLCHVENLRHI